MRMHVATMMMLATALLVGRPAHAADAPGCVDLAGRQPANGVVMNAGAIAVTPSAATAWQPRGGEVRFDVKAPSAPSQVQVCFAWPDQADKARASPGVRRLSPAEGGSSDQGTVSYAALVPADLGWAPTNWWDRINPFSTKAATASDGLGTVPLLAVIVGVAPTPADAPTPVVFYTRVGITLLATAIGVVGVLLGLCFWVVGRWMAKVKRRNAAAVVPAGGVPADKVSNRLFGRLLWMITDNDGFASLSQFQIVLWSVLVAASAVYVMSLNGTLVNISDGTLALLGIAGGTAALARVPPRAAARTETRNGLFAAEWSDIVVIDGVVDVTRVQMLLFTLVCAGFVLLKVIVGYQIPEIPTNFTLLMGISNGVYLTGRNLPSQKQ